MNAGYRVLGLVLLVGVWSVCGAIVFGGSNLPLSRYPEHECREPGFKPLPPVSRSRASISSYNFEVDMYNRDVERFVECVKEYVENGNQDIKRIAEAQEEAIKAVKALR